LSKEQIQCLYREADAFLNVTGAQEIRDEHLKCPRRIYVETDPFAAQVRVSQGHEPTIATLAAHDTLFSFGENLGAPDCDVPVERFRWHPTRQPIVLDLWKESRPAECPNLAYRTITTWHNKGKDLDFRGETYYWTKDREFLKFVDLPRRRPVAFELAACVDEATQRLLNDHGWTLTSALDVSNDVDTDRLV
jgi:hypothetical protein